MANLDFDSRSAALDRIAAEAQRNVKGLYTFEGRQHYEDSIHQQKLTTYLAPLREKVQDCYDMADAANAEADTLDAALYNDPLATVDNDTLARMAALKPFVVEELADMPMIALANRLRGVVAHGDEATQRLYLRLAKPNRQQSGGDRVAKLLEQLDERVNGKQRAALAKDTERAQDLRSKAIGLRMKASDTLATVDGTKKADMERRRREYSM